MTPAQDQAKEPKKKRFSPKARSAARQRVLQALYQWRLAGQHLMLIEEQFIYEHDMEKVDIAYFRRLLHDIPKHADILDKTLAPLLDRAIEQLDPTEHVILHIGLYELTYCPDIPWRVAINESVELAKTFGAEQSHKYVNSVLDNLARKANG
ncbi:MAG: transcription antitermination factor NusB [Gammaproteobacteria bacterium]|nr:transcription antitermination factor NusB [Gammaproteobacteria bacterium]